MGLGGRGARNGGWEPASNFARPLQPHLPMPPPKMRGDSSGAASGGESRSPVVKQERVGEGRGGQGRGWGQHR
jgi:hypothetical protein